MSSRFFSSLPALVLGLGLSACLQANGETCEINSDCESNVCCSGVSGMRGTCVATLDERCLRSMDDAGPQDGGGEDASTGDASIDDAATEDAATPDAASDDASTPDAATADASTTDASTTDASTDAGAPDAT